MPYEIALRPLTTLLFASVGIIFGAAFGKAATDERFTAICDLAAQRAAMTEGVPLDVLRAITRVETGRTRNGRRTPWPWTVNLEGRGFWFDTEAEAKAYVTKAVKTGARSFDVGCFQINYRWHGHAFRSAEAMFDPQENARYAARFLKDLRAELGSWRAAAGAYHSRTESLAAAYSNRFEATLAALDATPEPEPTKVDADPFTRMAIPLFVIPGSGGGATAMGSLVPVSDRQKAFIRIN